MLLQLHKDTTKNQSQYPKTHEFAVERDYKCLQLDLIHGESGRRDRGEVGYRLEDDRVVRIGERSGES